MRFTDRWLPPTSTLSLEQRWQARLLVEVLAIATVAAGTLSVVLAFSGDWLSSVECLVLAAAMPVGIVLVRRRAAVDLVANALLAVTAVVLVGAGLLEAHLDGAGLCWLGIVPFFGVLLRGPRSLVLWGPVALFGALALYLKPAGVFPTFELSPFVPAARAVGLLALLVVAALSFTRARGALAAELEGLNATKSGLLAAVSRELRGPLEGIVGTTELLLRRARDPLLLERLAVVARSGEAMAALIGDILDMDQVERGTLTLDETDFDPSALVADVVQLYRPSAEQKQVSLSAELHGAVPRRLRGASARLRQVLSNLVNNAIKFTDRGRIAIAVGARLAPDGRTCHLEVSVEDTGCGISATSLPRLFRPFEQGTQAAARRVGGTGLGLALCRELVSLMGGALQVQSQAGAGSRFSFEVPMSLAPPALEAESTDPSIPLLPGAPRPPPEGLPGDAAERSPAIDEARPPVLVVDDNPVNREVACEMLRELGHTFRAVEDGAEAVELLEKERFFAVLMDCRMPVLDGFEAARRIRGLEGPAARTPIIAVTASALPDELRRCRASGMDATLTKPLSVASLERALQAVCSPAQAPAPKPSGDGNAEQG